MSLWSNSYASKVTENSSMSIYKCAVAPKKLFMFNVSEYLLSKLCLLYLNKTSPEIKAISISFPHNQYCLLSPREKLHTSLKEL